MSDPENQHLKTELAEIKTSVAALQADVRRVVRCLLGDFENQDASGLLASHAAQAKELAAVRQAAEDHARRLAALEDARKWAIAYAAGMAAVIAVAYFVLEHHVNLPKIDLIPK